MMKKITCLLMATVILLSVVSLGAVPVAAVSDFSASSECLSILKQEEGFCVKPRWDFSQYTVGYGTRCPSDMVEYYLQNGITEAEATVLLCNALASFEKSLNKFIDKYSLTLTQSQFDALLLISYNCGTAWTVGDTLRNAVINGATGNEFLAAISLWCNAGGEINFALLRRRLSEANMYLNGVYSRTPPENYCYVYYDANGGEVEYRIQAYDSDLTALPTMTPTYEGYRFLGWYTERVGGTKVTVLDEATKDMYLYAQWEDGEGNVVDQGTWPVKVVVKGTNVNLRKGPGTGYATVGSANTGDELVITETATGGSYLWGKSESGWIALKYTDYDTAVIEQKPEDPEPEATEPETTEPEATEPETTEPETTEPETTEPETTEPETTEPETTEPETTEPETTEPETTEPEATEPETTEPETTEPEATEPEITDPDMPQTGTVKVSDLLCVRGGPGTGYRVIGYLSNGTKVTILEQETAGTMRWGKISSGWICLDYVVMDAVASDPEDSATEEDSRKGTVTGNDLRIRSGAGTTYSIVGYLNKGTKVEILETRQVGSVTWGRIASGWISMDYVELEQEDAADSVMATVKVDSLLRVRVGPGMSYAVCAYLNNGTRVEILEQRTVNGTVWGKLEQGWISLDYVTLDGQTNANPNAPTVTTKTVIADCLCVRSNAGTENKVVNYLYQGAKVQITDTKTVSGRTWGKISSGWICMDYVK